MTKTRTSWKPGESGNPRGRPLKGQSMAEAIRDELDDSGRGRTTKRQRIARKAVALAIGGDAAAMRYVRDTTEGTPQRNVNLSGDLDVGVTIVLTEDEDVP